MINEPILLSQYRKGDKQAYLVLYNKHAGPLRKFLQSGFSFSSQGRLCRFKGADSSMDLESIVQETFARAFSENTRSNYDGARPFQTYLFSIAKNLVLRECHHRDRLVTVEHLEDAAEASSNYSPGYRESYGISPELSLQNLQLKNITDRFIAELNDEEKQFFAIRFAEGNTQEGTAKMMSTTRARIKLLEKNMRRRFLDIMRKNGYFIGHHLKPRWKRKSLATFNAA